ncbi:MAG: hypothetical protein V9G20_13240 [Candidatus Promineifilaceae bacterium]
MTQYATTWVVMMPVCFSATNIPDAAIKRSRQGEKMLDYAHRQYRSRIASQPHYSSRPAQQVTGGQIRHNLHTVRGRDCAICMRQISLERK